MWGGYLFDYQVIAINDGSTDNSPKILDEYAKNDARLIVLHKKNGGPAAAREYGIENSQSDYIAFCDSDDYVEPDWLLCMYTYLKQYNADFSMVGAYLNDVGVDRVLKEPYVIDVWSRDESYEKFIEHKELNGILWTNLFKRSLFDGIEWNFEMNIYEDAFLVWQIINKIQTIVKVHVAKYHYMFNTGSLTNKPYNENRHYSTRTLIEKITSDCKKPELSMHYESAKKMEYKWTFSDLYNTVTSGLNVDDINDMRQILSSWFFKYSDNIKGLKNKSILILLIVNPKLAKYFYDLFRPKRIR